MRGMEDREVLTRCVGSFIKCLAASLSVVDRCCYYTTAIMRDIQDIWPNVCLIGLNCVVSRSQQFSIDQKE